MWRAAREEQERKTELRRAGEREEKREAERAVSTIVSDFVCDQLSEVVARDQGIGYRRSMVKGLYKVYPLVVSNGTGCDAGSVRRRAYAGQGMMGKSRDERSVTTRKNVLETGQPLYSRSFLTCLCTESQSSLPSSEFLCRLSSSNPTSGQRLV